MFVVTAFLLKDVPAVVGQSIPVLGNTVDVKNFGAKGDARSKKDGEMQPGSYVLTSESSIFSANDIGKKINVEGACVTGGSSATLEGTISYLNSPHSITVSPSDGFQCASLSGVTAATFEYGTNDYEAVNAALAAIERRPNGGTLYFPSNTGGYLLLPKPAHTTSAPASMTIARSDVTLIGDSQQTRIWTRGAYAIVRGSVVRGYGILLNGGRDGLQNITIKDIWLDGSTNGLTTSKTPSAAPADPRNGDNWDVTHSGIASVSTSTYSKIVIEGVSITNYRGEQVKLLGSGNDLVEIRKCFFSDTNADNVSISARRFKISGSTLQNASNACVENGLFHDDEYHVVQKVTCQNTRYNGMVFIGVDDYPFGSTKVSISENSFLNIGSVSTTAHVPSGVLIGTQHGNKEILSGIEIKNNIFRDCQNGVTLQSASDVVVTQNRFVIDRSSATAAINLVGNASGINWLRNTVIANNFVARTPNAVAKRFTFSPLIYIGPSDPPKYQYSVSFFNSSVEDNEWVDPGASVTNYLNNGQETAWRSLASQAVSFKRNSCDSCNFDRNHNSQNVADHGTILPLNDIIQVEASSGSTVTLVNGKVQDGHEVKIVTSGKAICFSPDENVELPADVSSLTISRGQEALFRYSVQARKWILISSNGKARRRQT